MVVKFHFKHEGGVPRGLEIPNNVLFIYWKARKEKIIGITQSLMFVLLFAFLSFNSIAGILPIAQGETWRLLFLFAASVAAGFLTVGICWKGPWATLLYAVMCTEGFEEYIGLCMEKMEQMLTPQNIKVTFLPSKEVNQIRRELMTAGLIRQLFIESNQIADIYDAIDFIADNCDDVRGFIIKEVKNAK